MMFDPTHDRRAISENPEWRLAFELSEVDNDNAPIGWDRYIPIASHLIQRYGIKPKALDNYR